jgi:His Kinase A (phosphoacceptor) domain.
MTNALYSRIEAIEMFAADVAHELKNPLTSLRSAVETLPLARNDTSRARLLEVIEARRQAARPADLGYFRRQPPRCRIAAPGHGAG